MSNYFHTSRRHCQGITNEDVASLVEVKLQEETKIQEDKWRRREDEYKRREDDFRASFMSEIKKIWREFQMNINLSSYSPPIIHRRAAIEVVQFLRIYPRFQR